MSIADGHDEDLVELKVLSWDKPHLPQVPEMVFFKLHGETQVLCTEQPKDKQFLEKFQYVRKEFNTRRNT